MVEFVESIKIWVVTKYGRPVIVVNSDFNLFVIYVIVAGHIVFIGAFPKAIDTLVDAVDINDDWFVGLPIHLFDICSEEFLHNSIFYASFLAIVSTISQHEGFHVGDPRLVMPEVTLEFFLAKAVFRIAFDTLLWH